MNEAIYWNPLVPELTVTSLETSLHFYLATGFSVRFRRDAPPFAYLELGQAQLMLEQQHAHGWNIEPLDRPLGLGVNFQIEVPDVSVVLAAMERLGIQLYRDMSECWYKISSTQEEGQKEFLVQDPDGFLLRFTQYLGQRNVD